MSKDTLDKAKRAIIGKYADWMKRFDVNDYIQNPPLIEKLFEEKQLALLSSHDLESQVKTLGSHIHDLELKNQALTIELNEVSRKSSINFFLSLIASVLIGIGVNIITSSTFIWTGWVMVAVACVLEIIAFLSKPKRVNNGKS